MHPQICTRVVSTCYLLQGFIQVVPVESQCFDVAVNDLLFTEDVRVQSLPNHHIRLLEDTDFKYWMKVAFYHRTVSIFDSDSDLD